VDKEATKREHAISRYAFSAAIIDMTNILLCGLHYGGQMQRIPSLSALPRIRNVADISRWEEAVSNEIAQRAIEDIEIPPFVWQLHRFLKIALQVAHTGSSDAPCQKRARLS
jgi:hypothetical protein